MKFLELAKKRYSVRKYQTKPVEQEKLAMILEAGRVAPTAANFQPQRILVLQEKDNLAEINKTANTFNAPLVIVVCGNTSEAWERPVDTKNFTDIDTSVVTTHMMMQAADLELGSVWIGIFDPAAIKESFNLPDEIEPINILAIGYPDEEALSPERHSKTRKYLNETVFYEKF
jgi:nitroreductase